MPIEKMVHYEFGGNTKVKLWTVAEMAKAMGVESGEKLIEMISAGGHGIVYHFREPVWKGSVSRRPGRRIVGYEYYFQRECYEDNVKLARKKGWIK